MMTAVRDRIVTRIEFDTNGGCWLWSGAVDEFGYGRINIRGRNTKAHRAAFLEFTGAIPEGREVLHTCDTPCCVNPAHLIPGTHAYHQQLHARLAASDDWPEFPPRKSMRPRCEVCRKPVQYDSVTRLCSEHYFGRLRASPGLCRVSECGARAGTRSGLCLAHVRERANKRRYQQGWDFNG